MFQTFVAMYAGEWVNMHRLTIWTPKASLVGQPLHACQINRYAKQSCAIISFSCIATCSSYSQETLEKQSTHFDVSFCLFYI